MFTELRLEVNKPCNLACVHCYTVKRRGDELSEACQVDLIKEAGLRGAASLSLTGGEPLLNRVRTLALIRAGVAAGLQVRLNTNGVLLSEDNLNSLVEAGLAELQISLNGATASFFDAFVQRPGAFAKVVHAIRRSAATSLVVCVRFTLTRSNREHLLPTFELVNRLGARRFKVRALVQVSGVHDSQWADHATELTTCLEQLRDAAALSAVEVLIADNGLGVALPYTGECRRMFCKCGTDAVFVSANGSVSPCPFLREEAAFSLGNVREEDLFTLVDRSPIMAEFIGVRTSSLAGNCCTHSCRSAELMLTTPVTATGSTP